MFALPLLFAWRALTLRNPVAHIVVGLYAYLFYAITIVSSKYSIPGLVIPIDVANYFRMAVHLFVFFVLLVVFLLTRPALRIPRFIKWGGATLVGMLFSAFENGAEPAAIARIAATGVMLVNLLILIPNLAIREKEYFLEVRKGCILIAVYLSVFSVYTLLLYGAFPEWRIRLGRPLNPGILSYLIATATAASFLTDTRIYVRAVLGIAVLAAASRADAALVLGIYFIVAVWRGEWGVKVLWATLALATTILVLLSAMPNETESFYRLLFVRDDFYSGRLEIWTTGVDNVMESPWLGKGDRTYVGRFDPKGAIDEETALRSHNMFLELAMSYGIPVAILAFSLYFSIAAATSRLRNTPGGGTYAFVGLAMVSLALGHSMVDTSFWTNLGDGTNVLILSISGPLALLGERVHARPRAIYNPTLQLRRPRYSSS